MIQITPLVYEQENRHLLHLIYMSKKIITHWGTMDYILVDPRPRNTKSV